MLETHFPHGEAPYPMPVKNTHSAICHIFLFANSKRIDPKKPAFSPKFKQSHKACSYTELANIQTYKLKVRRLTIFLVSLVNVNRCPSHSTRFALF